MLGIFQPEKTPDYAYLSGKNSGKKCLTYKLVMPKICPNKAKTLKSARDSMEMKIRYVTIQSF